MQWSGVHCYIHTGWWAEEGCPIPLLGSGWEGCHWALKSAAQGRLRSYQGGGWWGGYLSLSCRRKKNTSFRISFMLHICCRPCKLQPCFNLIATWQWVISGTASINADCIYFENWALLKHTAITEIFRVHAKSTCFDCKLLHLTLHLTVCSNWEVTGILNFHELYHCAD